MPLRDFEIEVNKFNMFNHRKYVGNVERSESLDKRAVVDKYKKEEEEQRKSFYGEFSKLRRERVNQYRSIDPYKEKRQKLEQELLK